MKRLQTKEQRAAMRAIMTPKGSALDPRSSEHGAIYTYEQMGKLYAIAFCGSAGNPTWHYCFRTAERREAKITEFFEGIESSRKYRAEYRASIAAFKHDVQVGDIFRASWGYDQTNIDFYQVVRLIGEHMAEVREIQQRSQETGFMSGDCVPAPGKWATEADWSPEGEAYKREHGQYPRKEKAAFRVRIQGSGNSGPCIKVSDVCHAYRIKPLAEVAGTKVYASSHWTAYA